MVVLGRMSFKMYTVKFSIWETCISEYEREQYPRIWFEFAGSYCYFMCTAILQLHEGKS